MPHKNPTPELLETIRIHGRCDETGVHAAWGYHAKASPRIFLLEKGEELPAGWRDCPFPETPARTVTNG